MDFGFTFDWLTQFQCNKYLENDIKEDFYHLLHMVFQNAIYHMIVF